MHAGPPGCMGSKWGCLLVCAALGPPSRCTSCIAMLLRDLQISEAAAAASIATPAKKKLLPPSDRLGRNRGPAAAAREAAHLDGHEVALGWPRGHLREVDVAPASLGDHVHERGGEEGVWLDPAIAGDRTTSVVFLLIHHGLSRCSHRGVRAIAKRACDALMCREGAWLAWLSSAVVIHRPVTRACCA